MLLKKTTLIVALFAVFLSGCNEVKPFDDAAFKQSQPKSIVIIPPKNNSIDVSASSIYLSTLTRPLAEKGYYVLPVVLIDEFLKANGLPTPAEMNTVPLDKIREHTGADAVLYITIERWGQKFQIVNSATVVSAQLKLLDAKTGTLLWQETARASDASDNSGLDWQGAILNAIVTQVMAAAIDNTPNVARQANSIAISTLPDGPYRAKSKK